MMNILSNKSNDVALTNQQLIDHLKNLSKETDKLPHRQPDETWPIVVGKHGDLYGHVRGRLDKLKDVHSFFAWVGKFACCTWHRGANTVSREVFFNACKDTEYGLRSFEWISTHPHYPAIPGVYYDCDVPEPAQTGALDRLVNRFQPASDCDRKLIKALFMTMPWGGPCGKRPAFVLMPATSLPPRRIPRAAEVWARRPWPSYAPVWLGVPSLLPRTRSSARSQSRS
jgi:hypothetical protein